MSQVKLIAEPWDVGEGGYQVGNFPVLWTEWNGKFRDAVRDFWRGHEPSLSPRWGTASRARATSTRPTVVARTRRSTSSPRTTGSPCTTSSPTTTSTTRPTVRQTPTAPTTTVHGTAAWRATPTIPTCLRLRERQKRNFLATLLLAQGVPMLVAGDELGPHPTAATTTPTARTTRSRGATGSSTGAAEELLAFTRRLIAPTPRATRCSAAGASSRAGPSTGRASPTSAGSRPTVTR